jgi:hypothetical protein
VYVDSYLWEIEMIFRSSGIYLGLSATFGIPSETNHLQKNLQLPPGTSNHYQDPLASISIFLELSATFSIFPYHSVTFRVFLPLPESSSIFLELSATLNIFHCHSVTLRVFHPLPVVNVVDSPRKMFDPGSVWKDLEVTECQ